MSTFLILSKWHWNENWERQLLCRSFWVLQMFKTSPSFHIKYFSISNDSLKTAYFKGCRLRHKFLYIAPHDLFIIAWRFLISTQFSCLACKPQLLMKQTNQGVKPFSISVHDKYKKWFGVQKKLHFFDVFLQFF